MAKYITPINEITLHYKRPHISDMPIIKNTDTAVAYLREVINENQMDLRESAYVMLFTSTYQLLGIAEIGVGTTVSVLSNLKMVFQLALLANASGIITAHTHPTGILNPSNADYVANRNAKQIGKILNVTIMDDLIITSESYRSVIEN